MFASCRPLPHYQMVSHSDVALRAVRWRFRVAAVGPLSHSVPQAASIAIGVCSRP